MRGNIKAIRAYADKLELMDTDLTPFTTQLRQLARSFDTEAIQKIIQQFLDGHA